MKIAIRADASRVIGSGHVMRCLTLAERLRSGGADVLFVCRAHEGNLVPHIKSRGFACVQLPLRDADATSAYATWVGAKATTDADETGAVITEHFGGGVDWVIVDHYGLDASWEQRMRHHANHLMVIDDLADRDHFCDVLLDQNLVDNMGNRYLGKVPAGAVILLGPRYALLQPEYRQLRPLARPRANPPRSFLVYFGGGETGAFVAMTVSAILRWRGSDAQILAVVSETDPNMGRLRRIAKAHANLSLVHHLPSLAQAMLDADLAVGAAGATSWERLCLGLPSIIVTMADNQAAIADQLHRRGWALSLGHVADLTESAVYEALLKHAVLPLAETIPDIDGRGTDRVFAAMASQDGLHARPVERRDTALLLEWANDPETRANSFSHEQISPSDHKRWLEKYLVPQPEHLLLIVEAGVGRSAMPVGQVRFDKSESAWTLNYAVAPDFRRMRLADKILDASLSRLRDVDSAARVNAKALPHNTASIGAIERAGFKRTSESAEAVAFLLEFSPAPANAQG